MTKHRPNRFARFVFRLGVALCVLIVAASAVSFRWAARVSGSKTFVSVNYGSLYVYVCPDELAIWDMGITRTKGILIPWTTKTTFTYGTGIVTGRTFPMWMFLLATLIPTAIAWRRLRRPLPGHCRQCGYNLKGNKSGTCPECGREIDAQRVGASAGGSPKGSKDDFKAIP